MHLGISKLRGMRFSANKEKYIKHEHRAVSSVYQIFFFIRSYIIIVKYFMCTGYR